MKKNSTLLPALVISMFGFAQSQGPNNPAQAISLPVINGRPWTNPTNVFTANGMNAMAAPLNTSPNCVGSNCFYSAGLATANYSFTVPGTATIDGIMVEIMRMAINVSAYDSTVRILKAGVPVGPNKALLTPWASSLGYAVYGGSTDLWGTAWTPADINNINFGTYLTTYNQSTVQQPGAMVDHIRITVYYTMPVGIQESVSSDDLVWTFQPAPNQLQVNYNLGKETSGNLSITSSMGQGLFSKKINTQAGSENIGLDGLSPGVYFVTLISDTRVQTKKIIIH